MGFKRRVQEPRLPARAPKRARSQTSHTTSSGSDVPNDKSSGNFQGVHLADIETSSEDDSKADKATKSGSLINSKKVEREKQPTIAKAAHTNGTKPSLSAAVEEGAWSSETSNEDLTADNSTGLEDKDELPENDSVSSEDDESDFTTDRPARDKSKPNDPTAFASSISAILSSKLTSQRRADPVLARSSSAKQARESVANTKLETKAKRKLRDDKRQAKDKGRVKDVLLGTVIGEDDSDRINGKPRLTVEELQQQERRLRKTAQRGVIKLFNAIRQAQINAKEARAKGGTTEKKEERATEMSKRGFLEMIATGGQVTNRSKAKMVEKVIEEA